ncbi:MULTISPECIES: methyl-accepting chemotaxis protein [unclassified Sphingomonas]|uniref:methyl-accepting chemotaxis protein n=1 Tax=unclassified Sphingomonas TaxID=196159 RepID=UPI0009ECA7D1|nr:MULTISPECIES: methyl-accepting chemotaxis protein [unclassified Sphingomonas]
MLQSLKIPRKLGLSFLLICASAAVMMAVFFSNISMIRSVTDANSAAQSRYAKALALETALLRQNSQMRGYLVTGDKTYLKSYEEGRVDYDKASAELEAELTDPKLVEAVKTSRKETLDWRAKWGDRLIKRVDGGDLAGAQAEVQAAGKAVLVSAAVTPLRDVRDAELATIEEGSATQEKAMDTATTVLIVGGIALIGLAIGLAWLLSRAIATPISALTGTMSTLASGRNDVDVDGADRADELGDMARAVLVFRDAAIAKQATDAAAAKAEAEQKMVVEVVSAQLSELADGNLTAQIDADFPADYAAVKANFNAAVTSLRGLIASVLEATSSIHSGSGRIAEASEDLARRTEANAASLEETSAAIVQMDQRLKTTAAAAGQTVERANGAIGTVANGRSVAEGAVAAMGRVADSAKGIDSVIEGLDKIAFQTRVLAMNAAVEAGRAGEAGRGFAVVADLVSALAMRAEEEAGRARDQLTATQTDIVAAVEMVQKVDSALVDISTDVNEVHSLLDKIAQDNHAQSFAITEVSSAISTMDQTTRQTSAMVEQSSTAARELANEVSHLADQAGQFTVEGGGRSPVHAMHNRLERTMAGSIRDVA